MPLSDYDQLLKEYLAYLKEIRGYSAHTITTYAIPLSQLKDYYKLYTQDAIECFDIKPFRMHIATQNPKTISKKLSAIRGFLEYLGTHKDMNLKLVGDHPIKVPQTLPKPINTEYIDEVLAIASLQEKALIYLMYGVGLRISEVASIRLENISKEWIRITGKGSKERQLPLLPIVAQSIEEYRAFAHPMEYLFEKKSKPMSVDQIRYCIHKLFKAQGIKLTPHQLRHTFATELLNNNARMSDISKLLGHTTMHSTQVYTKLASSKKLHDYMSSHPLCKD
ncbi:MAG: tyrosine-type recombinase/integrase [Campylobacterota bacterium]|nr:tyrosine-type recombinase/integrase [Campylobacterota bacterium]